MEPIVLYTLYFMIYSFLGWICECIYCSIPAKKLINRGFLSGPYCPIYGFGATAVILALEPVLYQPILLFGCGILVTSALEYITSWAMEALFHTKWWDYSTYFANINGRVCLKNSLLFGILVMVVMYGIHPIINDFIQSLPSNWQLMIVLIWLCIFLYDVMHTTISLLHRNQTFHELQIAIEELKTAVTSIPSYNGETPAEKLQQALARTDADERILKIVHQTGKKLELPKRYAKLKKRLEKAYPNQHLSHAYASMESILHTILDFKNRQK